MSDTLTRRGVALSLALATAACTAVSQPDGPPAPDHPVRDPDLVELVTLDPTIKLDVRYATVNNFIGRAVYPEGRVFLQRPAAEALVRVHRALQSEGLGLLVYDGYRPWSVTKVFWDSVSGDKRNFVADPKLGSRHNRGCAVDLSLYELASGQSVAMPTDYDEMTTRAYPDYGGGTPESRRYRDRLRAAMTAEGFTVHPREWWHYDFRDWPEYGVLDVPFGSLRR
ncbi:M15 family metallopeptidase [Methylolobus aquaticus]